jgi:hypothetical protein
MVVTPAANGNFAPYFKQKPQLKQADDGNKLIFECSLSANPQPSIEWWRGEEQLNESDGRTFFKIAPNSEADSYHVSLTLDDVVETDAGLYRVVARNASGEVAASINLNFSRKLNLLFVFRAEITDNLPQRKRENPREFDEPSHCIEKNLRKTF